MNSTPPEKHRFRGYHTAPEKISLSSRQKLIGELIFSPDGHEIGPIIELRSSSPFNPDDEIKVRNGKGFLIAKLRDLLLVGRKLTLFNIDAQKYVRETD